MAASTRFQDLPFGERVKIWKSQGGPGVTFQGGRDVWHSSTNKQFADELVAQSKAMGGDPVPVDANGDRYF